MLRDTEEYSARHPDPADIIVLAEVSDSSLCFDQGRKLTAYARAGVREYWIVNLAKRWVEVYREPSSDGTYTSIIRKQGDNLVVPEAFPDATRRVTDILGH